MDGFTWPQVVTSAIALSALGVSIRADRRSARADPRVQWVAECELANGDRDVRIRLRNVGRKMAWEVRVDPDSVRSLSVQSLPGGYAVRPLHTTDFWVARESSLHSGVDSIDVTWKNFSRYAFPWPTPRKGATVPVTGLRELLRRDV